MSNTTESRPARRWRSARPTPWQLGPVHRIQLAFRRHPRRSLRGRGAAYRRGGDPDWKVLNAANRGDIAALERVPAGGDLDPLHALYVFPPPGPGGTRVNL